ncbi:Uma2 family endonuclease [Rubrobacter tropicus]|uniref:Uma2 family endonuclease n=1 Tax=Rubrobacter tropicus TaxID=2653851 RepID=A0A6G8QE61_9ACTN|nr:Uma2 family endonuclease [Rubrobacter tropicus]QIN84794.1 Uma2 family endonuclease [Rubrobacter tropicus]
METVKSPAEQKVILHNASWETYERLMDERGDRRVPRFTYDRGELEIMSPSTERESIACFLELLVALVAGETDVNAYGVGSTTFKREDLERGFEPDACFYVQNEERIRGKPRIELGIDPPPDLVIEVDITSPSLSKFSVCARIGVPEIWRHDGERASVFVLREGGYAEVAMSEVLPSLSGPVLSRFVEESRSLGSAAWIREVRGWARSNAGASG